MYKMVCGLRAVANKRQSVSFYIGLVQAGSALFTVIIYILVLRRRKSKKALAQSLRVNGFEPVRH